ncbi:hypothetical protein CONCODRAFT_69062 [Conidiobolus coronatus NRRL 28638]|uniref:Transcription factor domain-containing protein n=1 Tax=Conidiobolus coronatus (strain ATCC 28846 / CBS 209.66 / NRRL 28638) TaxID=796925 RepID=A0A137PBJ0_CONC2|nr:hypothetical protein CONCODRAFT_69062 [Conidiobolus coronatus NRRL 28638]|eukprot:KXN72364.1 hypothetical protein CONCODRAFT_69062 [Conidiobolus coronatus NRRL 28638]
MSSYSHINFSSMEHFASYIVYSNRFPASHLFGEVGFLLVNLPQIKGLLSKSDYLIPDSNNNSSDEEELEHIELSGLSEIFKPDFWLELIKLYILNFHIQTPLFNLKHFDIAKLPQSLLTSIYCFGYNFKTDKTPELTDYMAKLAQSNVNRILFKTNLANAKALFIHHYNYYYAGKFIEGRAIIVHLTRMCHALGVHVDTKPIYNSVEFDRGSLYRNLALSHENLSTVYNLRPGFGVEIPNFNPTLYDSHWQLLNENTNNLLNLNPMKMEYYSKLCSLANEFRDKSLDVLDFSNFTNLNDEQITNLCLTKYNELLSQSLIISVEFRKLKQQYSSYSTDLFLTYEKIQYYYLFNYLLVFEFGRLKSNQLTPQLTRKILEIGSLTLEALQKIDDSSSLTYFYYLLGFNLMGIYNYLSADDKQLARDKLGVLFYSVKGFDKMSHLNYSLFVSGLNLIK